MGLNAIVSRCHAKRTPSLRASGSRWRTAVRPARDWPTDSIRARFCDPVNTQRTGGGCGIDDALKVGRQLRHPLNLIEDHPDPELTRKGAWVLAGEVADIEDLEVGVVVVEEHGAAEGELDALLRTGDGDGGHLPAGLSQPGGDVTFDDGHGTEMPAPRTR